MGEKQHSGPVGQQETDVLGTDVQQGTDVIEVV